MNGAPHIELTAADVAHEEQPAVALVHGVCWNIRPGERWIVCGGAGSGKSSLLGTVAGLTTPIAGKLRVFGQDYWGIGESERLGLSRRIGFVFDGGGRLFTHMSILQNLILPLQYHQECDSGTARTRALEWLALVELAGWADAAPARLSAARQRRVALARALVEPVDVLFLDMPLVGLAPEDRRWWLDFLGEIFARREASGDPMSLVASDHDLSRWLGWASHFGALAGGTFQILDAAEARARVDAISDPRAGSGT